MNAEREAAERVAAELKADSDYQSRVARLVADATAGRLPPAESFAEFAKRHRLSRSHQIEEAKETQ